jgi:hypothetical protein
VNYSYDYQSNQLLVVRQTREDGVVVSTSEYDNEGRLLPVISHDVESDRTTMIARAAPKLGSTTNMTNMATGP